MFVINRFTGDDQESVEEIKQRKLEAAKERIASRKAKRNEVEQAKQAKIEAECAIKQKLDEQRKAELDKKEKQEREVREAKNKRRHELINTNDSEEEPDLVVDDVDNVERNRKKNKGDFTVSVTGVQNSLDNTLNDIQNERESQPDVPVLQDKEKNVVITSQAIAKKEKTMPRWMQTSVLVDSDLADIQTKVSTHCFSGLELDTRVVHTLKREGVTHFFPIQRHVIPLMLRAGLSPGTHPGDVCVSAPTGSGKTLAYVVPVVSCLINRVVRQMRCLVLLPTRDLAEQVRTVFSLYTQNTSLVVVMVTGLTPFEKEKQSLVMTDCDGQVQSACDILIATPGRLVDHVTSTKGFTLEHLRYLVIDEADRLLQQSYQNWLDKILTSAYISKETVPEGKLGDLHTYRESPSGMTPSSNARTSTPLQKLIFSATLPHNPEKLASLQLHQPRLLAAGTDAKYVVPVGLKEYIIKCHGGEKPMVLLHLLLEMKLKKVLVFTSSVDATHRLFLLLKLYGGMRVAEFSSSLSQTDRKKVLKHFTTDKLDVMICSDAMARGMDVSNVQYVVCYDTPSYIKTYIHRVGRTARAGRGGEAYTIVKHDEVKKFKSMMSKAAGHKLKEVKLAGTDLDKYEGQLNNALQDLKVNLDNEEVDFGIDGSGIVSGHGSYTRTKWNETTLL
eukprot:CFRG0061T1